MRHILIILIIFSFLGCADNSEKNSPSYRIVNKNIYFGLYTDGSRPTGSIDIENLSRNKENFDVKILFLDREKRIVSDSIHWITGLPSGMRQEIIIRSSKYFTYPEEGWSYIINVNEKEVERGPLPVKWK